MESTETSLAQLLIADSQAFLAQVRDLPESQFSRHIADKWSVADVMQHLYLSARPVTRLMTGPREVLLQWGTADRSPKTYDDIESTYLKIMATGAKAPASMTPRAEDMQVDKQTMVDRFTDIYQTLVNAIDGWSDQELDTYCIPHPAFGKLTVREMLYFTGMHTLYHLKRLPVA